MRSRATWQVELNIEMRTNVTYYQNKIFKNQNKKEVSYYYNNEVIRLSVCMQFYIH